MAKILIYEEISNSLRIFAMCPAFLIREKTNIRLKMQELYLIILLSRISL